MASKSRQQSSALDVLAEIQEAPYQYGFFDVLRYLEACHDDSPRLGESVKASDDPVFIRQQPSMAFAPATISRFEQGYRRQHQIYNWAYGVFGPNGPMPLHLTEYACEREMHHSDETLSRFADVFHHRIISLLYRAWANTQPSIEMDRPESNKFDLYVGAIAGLSVGDNELSGRASSSVNKPGRGGYGSEQSPDAHEADDHYLGNDPADSGRNSNSKNYSKSDKSSKSSASDYIKMFRAGLFSQQVRSADGLETLLSGYFKTPFFVTQYCGDWLTLKAKDSFRLGSYGYANSLGVNSSLGARVYDCQHKFSLSSGVLSFAQFERLLPGGEAYETLYDLVSSYMGITFEWDLTLQIDRSEIPRWGLGQGARLGWSHWLGSAPLDDDVIDDDNRDNVKKVNVVEVQLQSRSANHYGSDFGE